MASADRNPAHSNVARRQLLGRARAALDRWWRGAWVSVAVGAGFALLYLLTLYPGPGGRINFGDSVKFALLPIVNGTPHATGYPTYLMLGKLLQWLLPQASGAFRGALLSALPAAVAVALLQRVALRLGVGQLAAAAGAASLGLGYSYWALATEAEVYALHLLFVCGVLLAMVRFIESGERRDLLIACAIYALSFGNHMTTITLLPALIVATAMRRPRAFVDPRVVLPALAFIALGALQYGYLYYLSYLPGASHLECVGSHTSVSKILGCATGGQFRQRFLSYSLIELVAGRFGGVLKTLGSQLGVISALLVGVGCARFATSEQRSKALFLLLALLGQLAFALVYDMEVGPTLLPVFACLGLAFGVGVARLRRLWVRALVAGAALALTCAISLDRGLIVVHNEQLARVVQAYGDLVPCEAILIRDTSYMRAQIASYITYSGEPLGPRLLVRPRQLAGRPKFCVEAALIDRLPREPGLAVRPLVRDTVGAMLARHRDDIVVLAVSDDAARRLSDRSRALLKEAGSRAYALRYRQAYLAVLRGGRVVAERGPASRTVRLRWRARPGGPQLTIVSGGFNGAMRAEISLRGKNLAPDSRGLNIVAFDRKSMRPLAARTFDTYLGDEQRRVYLVRRCGRDGTRCGRLPDGWVLHSQLVATLHRTRAAQTTKAR